MRGRPSIGNRAISGTSFCAAIFLVLVWFSASNAQQTKEALSSIYTVSDNYSQLLDRLFPREKPNFREVERQIVLRVRPSFTAEWQLTIRQFRDGHSEATYFEPEQLAKSNLYYYLTYFELDKGSPATQEDLDTLAKGAHVHVKTLSRVTPAIDAAIKQFQSLGIPTKQETNIVFDGTTYEIWAQTGADELHASLWGLDPDHVEKERPLVKWIVRVSNLVKSAIEQPSAPPGPKR